MRSNSCLLWLLFTELGSSATASTYYPSTQTLLPCGDAFFESSRYTCYDEDFLCPILHGQATLRCGPACYNPDTYSCLNGELVQNDQSSTTTTAAATCTETSTTQWLSDPPYENYLYSDCHSASQVVVTSPLQDSNLTVIGPRLLVAWPAGSSGVVAYFQPQSGVNGTLSIRLVNGTSDFPVHGVYSPPASESLTGLPFVGVSALLELNASAMLTVPILGSIRNIRDFTEGPSLLVPLIQDAIQYTETQGGGVELSRRWLDNVTTTTMSFTPVGNVSISSTTNEQGNRTLEFGAGRYNFTATFDYPQLTQLNASELLNEASQDLILQDPDETLSLAFLSYSQKLLAGAWRFLTYFGRDSMITTLLLQPVLSEGEGGAIEAVIGAVLERINQTSGMACHEETIGDYATYLNLMNNVTSTAPGCNTEQMIDTDFYLPPLMVNYFLETETGRGRREAFFATEVTLDFGNIGLTYEDLALINAERVMTITAAFAQPGGQIKENFIHLQEGESVGEWRDSEFGIGGGRIPYDVNTALVPAALRSISALSAAGFYPTHPEWAQTALEFAQVWEDESLRFFEVSVPASEARSLVEDYTSSVGLGFPSHAENITSDVTFYGLALDGSNNQSIVRVMNTDDCFRLFLLTNTTNDSQLTAFLNQTATNIRSPFPVGLSTPVGPLIANPAYGGDPVYAANWTNNIYHGTVIWGWQLAMIAAGLERQLSRCDAASPPTFCGDDVVRSNVLAAYNHLWGIIEANRPYINNEVWSWQYLDGDFRFIPLGALPPLPDKNPTESNIRQLWSLTWLAVRRNTSLV